VAGRAVLSRVRQVAADLGALTACVRVRACRRGLVGTALAGAGEGRRSRSTSRGGAVWRRRVLVAGFLLLAYGVMARSALATTPTNMGLPYVSGSFAQGQLLSAAPGDWVGTEPIALSYQWQRCLSYKDVVAVDSPAAYWRLGEAQGATSAADAASSPDNGTYSNLPELGLSGPLSGDPDRAVRFDGAGAYLDVPDASKLKPATAVSVEAWVKTTASNGVIADKPYATGGLVSYSLSVASGKATVAVDLGGVQKTLSSTNAVNDGAWHHIVGTFGSSTLSLYVDGVSAASPVTGLSGSLQYSTQKLQIGRFDTTGANYLAGTVDEVAVYSSALSSTRVASHASAGTTANGVDGNCSDIAGATSSFYTTASSDLGERVRVKVTGTNTDGSASASSYATAITPAAPTNADLPDITGTAQDGNTLTGGTGVWSGATPMTFAYQWVRCSSYPLAISADTPVGYWRLGEASGAAAADNGGSNGGTYGPSTGPPALGVPGALSLDADTAADFGGGSQNVALGQSVQFDANPFTVEAWFKTTTSTGMMTIWTSGHSPSSSSNVKVQVSSGKVKGTASSGGTGVTMQSANTYADGVWHQVAFVRTSSSGFKLYVDGTQVASTSTSIGDVDGVNTLGYIGNDDSLASGFNGSIDEVAIYNSALSATQVANHYSARTDGCTNIGGQTASTYALSATDAGTTVAVRVTATNSAGSASALSKPVAVIAKIAPINTSPPLVSGSPVVGQILTTSSGAWDQSGSSYSYQWRRCAPYQSTITTDGAVGYWRLGELNGQQQVTTAADTVGSNTGTYVGGPVLGAAGALAHDRNTGVIFDGSGQHANLSQSVQFDANPFTVEGWFKTSDASSSDTQQIWYSGKDTHNYSVQLWVSGGQVSGRVTGPSGSPTVNSAASSYADGAWHYVALTRSGNSQSLYVDNAAAVTVTQATGDVDDPISPDYIGAGQGGSSNFFKGALDEVAIYTTALTSTQVTAHRSAGLDPCTDIPGATAATYTLVSADSAKNVIVHVTATRNGLSGFADSADLKVAATGSPVYTTLPALPATPIVGQQLTVSNGSWNPAASSYSYQWHSCYGYQQTVASDHPSGEWRLNELNPPQNQGTSTAADSAGTNTGTYSGAVRFGRAGPLVYEQATGVSFDQTSGAQQVSLGSSVQFDSANFSVEAWVKAADNTGKAADTTGTNLIWSSGKTSNSGKHVDLSIAGELAQAKVSDGTGTVTLKSFNTIDDAAWHQLVLTRSGSTFNLYVDGAIVESQTSSLGDVDMSGQTAYIGNDFSGSSGFTGVIAEVAIYQGTTNGVLTSARVQAHYSNINQSCNPVGSNSNNYTPQNSDLGRRLYVTVTATNASGSTIVDTAESDSVYASAPTLDSPLDGSAVLNANPTLKVFNFGGPDAYSYDFQLSKLKDFATIADNSGWIAGSGSATTHTAQGDKNDLTLKDGGTYYWRVRALDTTTGAIGAWSTPQKIDVRLKHYGLHDYWPIWTAGPLAVNEATGNLILTIPGPTYPTDNGSMSLTLTYNSLDSVDHGLGKGWTLAAGNDGSQLPTKLVDHNNQNVADNYDEIELVYEDGGSAYYNHVGNSNVYKAPPGDISTLRKTGSGSTAGWSLTMPDGSNYTFGAEDNATGEAQLKTANLAAADPGKGELKYGFQSLSPTTKVLTSLTDDLDRKVALTWNAIDNVNCPNAIVCVTGPDNRTWKYTANNNGSVKTVFDGTRTIGQLSYQLDAQGAETGPLVKIQNANDLDPTHASPGYNATHSVTVAYNQQGQATQVSEGPITGQTPSTSTWTFDYHPGTTTTAGSLHHGAGRAADGYTEITPPREQPPPTGNNNGTVLKTSIYYDNLDHPIETVDLLGRTSLAAYDQKDRLLWIEDPDGNPTDYTYDPVTNLLLSKTDPDPDGNGPLAAPITKYRYDETTMGTNTAPGVALQGLQATYYRSGDFSGPPATRQTDPRVDFDWQNAGPTVLGGQRDSFSVRWTGTINLQTEGDYTFSAVSDGGVYLTIDDQQPLNDFGRHDITAVTSTPVHLTAGLHTIEVGFADKPDQPGATPPMIDHPRVQLRYSCSNCSNPISDQTIPSTGLQPNWGNLTTIIKPRGNLNPPNPYSDVDFSHYARSQTYQPDYTEQKLPDGTPLVTTYEYDSYGRTTKKISPRGNTSLTIDNVGNLNGSADTSYATIWRYYALTDMASPPAFCGGGIGTAVNQAGQLESEQPPATRATTYVYDTAGRAIAKSNEIGTFCSTYDNEGRLAQTKDANAHTTAYTYDPSGATRTVTEDPGGLNLPTTTVYDESAAVIAKTDANNHTTTFSHDAEGNQTAITDPLNHTTATAYDALGRKTSITDPLGHVTSYVYDNEGRLISTVVDPGTGHLNLTTRSTYDALGRAVTKTDARGHDTTYVYDADGHELSVADSLNHVASSSYDNVGRLVSKTDANNHTTSYGYDLDGNQASVTAADGGVTTTAYDPAGRPVTEIVDPDSGHLNLTTAKEYDSAGRLIRTTIDPGSGSHLNQMTSATYDAVGNKLSDTDPSGRTTTYTYDAVNRQITSTTPLSHTTTIAYDNVGNKTSVIDPLGHVTIYAYDAADRLATTTIDPGGGHLNITNTTAYDNAGRVSSKTDPSNHTTSYTYDSAGRTTSVAGPDGSNTTLTYDGNGNLLSRTDDNNHTTSFTYDNADRQVSKTDPLGHQWTYSYDAVGNRTQIVDGNGNATPADPTDGKTIYSYDSLDRLTAIDYSDSTADVTYIYDLAGRKTAMTDGAGTVAYSYDNANHLRSVTRGSSSFSYGYDTGGRLSSRTYPDGTVTGYTYDADSRLSVTTVGSDVIVYTFDNTDRLTAIAYPNGWTEQRSYDNADRLATIQSVKTGSTDIAVAAYTRDPTGNPTTIVRDGITETYSYDDADRVTGVCYGGSLATCASGSKITYSYDKVGNRLTQTKFGTITTFTYDSADELVSTTTNPTTIYTYDNDGQQTGEGTRTFTYDLAGELTQVADGSTILASFTYDGNGNRLSKTSDVTTAYSWDENQALPQLATETQGSGVVRSYHYGVDLISMTSGGSSYYYQHDALGSTAALTKDTGAIEWVYTYDPYGVARNATKVDSTAPINQVQFTGELIDGETSLYDLRARTYEPAVGRLLTTDPISGSPSSPSTSAYAYVADRPLVATDPSGEMAQTDCASQSSAAITADELPINKCKFVTVCDPYCRQVYVCGDKTMPVPIGPLPKPQLNPHPSFPKRPRDPVAKRRQFACSAKCNVYNIKSGHTRQVVGPTVIGSNEQEACAAAKKAVPVPRGHVKRHCKCDCRRASNSDIALAA
jgi:RHS repeat-associated protein